MSYGLRMRELAILVPALAAGLVGAVVALAGRSADANFLNGQRHVPPLKPAEVARVVRSAPDPTTGKGQGSAATCTPGSPRGLRNPWSCVVRYPSGRSVRLTVRVSSDGTYLGRYAGGGAAEGCCVYIPGSG